MPEETTDEDIEGASEESSVSITSVDTYNEMLKEEAAKQGTARAEATSASLKVLEKMTENNTLSDEDKAALKNYSDAITDSKDLTTEFPKIQTAFNELSPDNNIII